MLKVLAQNTKGNGNIANNLRGSNSSKIKTMGLTPAQVRAGFTHGDNAASNLKSKTKTRTFVDRLGTRKSQREALRKNYPNIKLAPEKIYKVVRSSTLQSVSGVRGSFKFPYQMEVTAKISPKQRSSMRKANEARAKGVSSYIQTRLKSTGSSITRASKTKVTAEATKLIKQGWSRSDAVSWALDEYAKYR